jgi:lipoprotein signal peptidase
MGGFTSILAAFGLSAASGLNAYIPLLMVGLTARFTNWITLAPPFDVLTNEWVLGALVVLLGIEFFADKIPVVDHVNDVIQTFVRPAAGAILFASEAHVITSIHPVIAIILGLLVAFGVHATKATARPVVTVATGGIGNPIVSTIEDVASFGITLTAILAPILLLFALALLLVIAYRLWTRKKAPALAASPSKPEKSTLDWPKG